MWLRRLVRSSRRCARVLVFSLQAALVAVASLVLPFAVVGVPLVHADTPCASEPCIVWDNNLVYSGVNNGNPEGPLGERLAVHARNFAPGQKLRLMFFLGDSNADPNRCENTGASYQPGFDAGFSTTVGASGQFDATVAFPSFLENNDPSFPVPGLYSICAVDDSGGGSMTYTYLSHLQSPGPYTLLTRARPTITVASTVAAGGMLAVRGQNWLPSQVVHVALGVCHDCATPAIAATDVTSGSDPAGTFEAQLTIPTDTAPGDYVVTAFNETHTLDVGNPPAENDVPRPDGAQHVSVTAALPTATATPTSTAIATATSQPRGAGSKTNSAGGPSSAPLVVLAGLFLTLLAGLCGLLTYVFMTRRRRDMRVDDAPGGGRRTPMPPAYNDSDTGLLSSLPVAALDASKREGLVASDRSEGPAGRLPPGGD